MKYQGTRPESDFDIHLYLPLCGESVTETPLRFLLVGLT